MIAAGSPDLLIVDLAVGEWAGWDLLERVRTDAVASNIPTIVTSTSEKFIERASKEASQFGSYSYLLKPFDIDAVLRMVHGLIGEA
jgi:DNA-binding response OmpR family regulator